MWCLSFWDWPLSVGVMSSSFTHVVACDKISSLLRAYRTLFFKEPNITTESGEEEALAMNRSFIKHHKNELMLFNSLGYPGEAPYQGTAQLARETGVLWRHEGPPGTKLRLSPRHPRKTAREVQVEPRSHHVLQFYWPSSCATSHWLPLPLKVFCRTFVAGLLHLEEKEE